MSGQHETIAQVSQPRTVLSVSQILCPWHEATLKNRWQSAYPSFAVDGLSRIVQMDDFIRETGCIDQRVDLALLKRPICCRLPRETVVDIMRAIEGFTKVATCEKCGFRLDCVGFDKLNTYGRISSKAHVFCLSCACAYAEDMKAQSEHKLGR